MPDPTTLIAGSVTLLSAIGGGIAWVVRRRDTQRDPIPKESAAVALAQSGVALMQGVADRLEERINTLEGEVVVLREGHDHLRVTLSAAARYIERLLRWAKSESRPPLPPLPSDIRDLIDPSLHD